MLSARQSRSLIWMMFFNVIPYKIVKMLEMKLEDLFDAQVLAKTAADLLATNPTDSTLKLAVPDLMAERQSA